MEKIDRRKIDRKRSKIARTFWDSQSKEQKHAIAMKALATRLHNASNGKSQATATEVK